MPPPAPNFQIDAPTVIEAPRNETIIIVPKERRSFQDGQKPIHIPIPQDSVPGLIVPQPQTARIPMAPRRIDPSRATTIEKYVIGEVACPLDLLQGSIVRMCNAHSGTYKLSQKGDGKYFHQQQCWFCENILLTFHTYVNTSCLP